ncbi:transmembrane protein 223-like [Babylonia areolata]|uniref:transmembrane protein 223-like n=1 Tax=Babylonia areolata TaxID=304850 RepID=UPI003FD067D9
MAFLRFFCKCTEHLTAYNSRLLLFRTTEQCLPSATRINADQISVLRRQMVSSKKKLPFEVETANMKKDILVYSHTNERFYKLLTYFGCAQFAFWAYLALFSFQTLKDAPPSEPSTETDTSSWWRRMAAKESKYKNGISILCFAFGYTVLCISVMYPMRAVKQLWLLKGGNFIRLETYSVIARQQSLTVPVSNISCLQSRTDSAAQIPMKVKGRWFFYLLDKRGHFHNTQLFDFAVGLSRAV